jgi:hypothetical protein
LANIREEKEAGVALLLEGEAMARRHRKVERLERQEAWRKRMEHQRYERMMTELSKLTLEELDEDMETIQLLGKNQMICESGGYTGKYSTIPIKEVKILNTDKKGTKDTIIRWADEQMDTITISTKDTMDKGLMMNDDMKMANTDLGELNMDTMSEEVGILPEGEEGKFETLCGMGGSQLVNVGSVVGMENLFEYPNHCGSGHTPLLGPATIPENGVGYVIGLLVTGENGAILTEEMQDDDTHIPWPKPIHSVREQCVGTVHTPCLGTSTQAEQQMPGID